MLARYRIEFRPAAWHLYRKLPKALQRSLASRIDALVRNPRPDRSGTLQERPDVFRIDIGSGQHRCRLLYQFNPDIPLLAVVTIRRKPPKGVKRDGEEETDFEALIEAEYLRGPSISWDELKEELGL